MIKNISELLQAAIHQINEDVKMTPNLFKEMELKDLSQYASALQQSLLDKIPQGISFQLRPKLKRLDTNNLEALIRASKSGLLMLVNAGEKQTADTFKKLSTEETLIEMMREPYQSNASISFLSALNFVNLLVSIKYLKEKYLIGVNVFSSKNHSAIEPASALSFLISNSLPTKREYGNSIAYPDKSILPTSSLKKHLNKGRLPFEKKKVDAVCGEGTHHIITENMRAFMQTHAALPNQITVFVTHPEQLKAFSHILKIKSGQFREYGFVGIDTKGKKIVKEQGLSAPKAKTPLPSPFKPCGGIHAAVFPDNARRGPIF
jgi:hypothetical protein